MISASRYALFVCLLIYAFAQTRGARPSVTISDGVPAVAGRINTLIIQVQNVQPGFRISVVALGGTTPITGIWQTSPGQYYVAVPLPLSQQPYSANLVLVNPNGLSGSAEFRVVPYVQPIPRLAVVPRVYADQPSTVSIPGTNFQEGVRVFWGRAEQKAALVQGVLTVDSTLLPAPRMPYITQLTIINPCGLRANPCGLRAVINVEVVAAQPAITKLQGEVTAGFDSTLTIRGSNFQPGLRVFVGIPQQPDVELTKQMRVVAADQVVLSLKMPLTPTPPYQARLTVMNQIRSQWPATERVERISGVRGIGPRLQPVITNIDPPTVPVGQQVKLSVTGKDFQKNLQVFIKVGDAVTEVTKSTSFMDQSKLTIALIMSNNPAAPYTATLRISNPGGLSTSRDFSVTPN